MEVWHGAAAGCPVLCEAGDSSSQGVCHASVLWMMWGVYGYIGLLQPDDA